MIVGKLTVLLGLDSKGFTTGINSATGKTTAFAKATDKTFKAIAKAAKIGMLAVGAAFVKGSIDAAKFEKALANVSTMLDKNTMPMMKNFEKGIIKMSEAYGESTDALAKGLYDILSASVPASQALDVLEISAQAAKAGLTDTGIAADAITTLMNSFQDATKDASYYADIMFATVKFGKTTFAELAPVIGNVAKMMETAGGTAEEMAGMLAIMTRNGIQTRVAVTSLRGVVAALIKPSEALTKELGGMTVEADGFRAVMDKIGSLPATDLAEMFPNIRALTGVVVAAKGLGAEVDKINSLMADGSPMMAAFDKNMSTFAATWDRFKATLKATSITIGNELLPVLKEMFEDMITWFQDNREGFARFAKETLEGIRKLITTIIGLKEILLGAGAAIMSMMILSKIIPLMASFGIATSISLGPVALIAASITLLIGGFIKLKKELKEEKEEQQLLNEAMTGGTLTSDEYNKALEIQSGKLKAIRDAHDSNISRMVRTGMVSKEQMDIAQKSYDSNIKFEQGKIDLITKNAGEQWELDQKAESREKAEAERKRADFIDEQNRITALNIAETEKAALLRQLDAEETQRILDVKKAWADAMQDKVDLAKSVSDIMIKENLKLDEALWQASASESDRIERRRGELELLGRSYEDIEKIIRIEFSEAFNAAKEASDIFWDEMGEESGEFVEDTIPTIAQTFVDKWTEAVASVKEVFTLMYSAMSGVTDQYFKNMFAKLDTEQAERKKKARDTITDEDALATALEVIDKDIAKKKYDLELKQFKVTKAMNIAEAIMNTAVAVSKALPNVILAAIVAGLGAAKVALIATQQPPAPPFIRGGLTDKMISGGAVRGNPGIDTNQIAVTNREYIMPPQQTADNFDELEDMRSGGSGGKNITIVPAQVDLIIEGRKVGQALIEFMTAESDRGGFRMNPKVLGVTT